MDALQYFKERVADVLDRHCRVESRGKGYAHLFGVSSLCALLARKRGLDTEMCAVAGLLHDIYTYRANNEALHAHSGAEMARVMLKHSCYFTGEKRAAICAAIFNHSTKTRADDACSEALKDADTLQPYLVEGSSASYAESPARLNRLERLSAELCIPFPTNKGGVTTSNAILAGAAENAQERAITLPKAGRDSEQYPTNAESGCAQPPSRPSSPSRAAAIALNAERLAASGIRGERGDAVYMDMIRYWPEEEAFDELKNGWCAAFVYHVCVSSGLMLPIKYPGASARLAGVGAWYEWASRLGFYHEDNCKFKPQPGDIVIYNGIIPPGRKPADASWHDHIGVVAAVDGESLTVAEGNVDNGNVSGVTRRIRGDRIGGYIRVPEEYVYDKHIAMV